MNDRLYILMQDETLRKEFGARVKQLRKQRHWQQKQLAAKIDIRFQLLNKYESGQHIPPADTLIRLANALDTTIDYLLTGNPIEESPLQDSKLFRRFRALEDFDDEDKETVIKVIDALIAKRRVEGAIQSIDKEAS